jgi:hypothetical protein
MSGLDYWRARPAPLARDGYLRGFVDDESVFLFHEVTGDEVQLPRPSASWHLPVLPSLDGLDQPDPDREESARGIRWLMKVGNDRLELTT